MIDTFLRNLLKFKFLTIFIILLSVIFFGYHITNIQVDNDTIKAIPPKLQAKINYDNLKKQYPAPYNILFLAEFSGGELDEKIDSIKSWSSAFEKIPGTTGISSLNSVQIPVKGGFFGITSDYLLSRKTQLSQDEIRKRISENKEFSAMFISGDESVVGMVIGIQNDANRTVIMDNILKHMDIINANEQITSYVTSEGAVSYFIDKAMKHDFAILLPICFLLVFLLLYRIFHKFLYVVAALMVNVLAIIWTFGLIGLLKVPFSVVTSIIPVILFPIGVADAIHLLKLFRESKVFHNGDTFKALKATYDELFVPCLLTSITTFIGFASFAFSEISWTRVFGFFTGIAVIMAFVFNIILLPLFLSFEKTTAKKTDIREEKWLSGFWRVFAKFSVESKLWTVLIPVLLIVFVIGFRTVRVESNSMTMLPEKNMLRQSDDFIAKHFGGTRFFSIVLESKDGKLSSKQKWEQVDEIATYINNLDEIGNVASVVPLLKKVSGMLSGERLSDAAVSMITGTKGFFGKNYMQYLKSFLAEDR
ncbi:MAG: MMPL family transporter, partial [Fibrobacter sp.]|nr:MMPL family transporter [Fibrobacter sp.]